MFRTCIAYEIFRREDGMIALSVNAGLLPANPLFIELDEDGGAVLRPGKGVEMCCLARLPDDLIAYARDVGKIELYEFSAYNLVAQHDLVWSEET